MRYFRNCVLVALGGLSSACQSQPPQQEGAYVDFVVEVMVESATLSRGPSDAQPAVRAIEAWRGTGEEEGAD